MKIGVSTTMRNRVAGDRVVVMKSVVFDGYNVTVNGRLIEAHNSRFEHPDMKHYLMRTRVPGDYETACGRFTDVPYFTSDIYKVNCMACLDYVIPMMLSEGESDEVEDTGVGAPVTEPFYY